MPNTQDKHIKMYLDDGWKLYQQMVEDMPPNIQVLNSLLLMFSNALNPIDLETKVLPEYTKYRIQHDVYTYQHLTKMYLNMLDLEKVIELYRKCLAAKIAPNKLMLSTVLEAGLRKEDSDVVYDVLTSYVELKQEPHIRQLKTLSMLKHIPDRLFVLIRKNFNVQGKIGLQTRQFEKPTFRKEGEDKLSFKTTSNYKRTRNKKRSDPSMPKVIRK